MIQTCKFTDPFYAELTPLHVARNGEVVRALIAGGARINDSDYKNNFGASPLCGHMIWCNLQSNRSVVDCGECNKSTFGWRSVIQTPGLNAPEMAFVLGLLKWRNYLALLKHLPIQIVLESLPDIAPDTLIRFAGSEDFGFVLDHFLASGKSKGITSTFDYRINSQPATVLSRPPYQV